MTAITSAPVMQMVLKSESGTQRVIKCKNLTDSILGMVSIYKGYYAYWTIKWSIHVAFRSITNIFNIFLCVNHSKLPQVRYIYLPCFVNKASKLSNLHHSASSVIIFFILCNSEIKASFVCMYGTDLWHHPSSKSFNFWVYIGCFKGIQAPLG